MQTYRLCLFVLISFLWSNCGEKKNPPAIPEKQQTVTSPESKSDTPLSKAYTAIPDDSMREKKSPIQATPPPPAKIPPKTSKPPGPPAYITQSTALMYAEPSDKATKIPHNFKVSENIYILETKMTDESGNIYEIPQWHKIQCSDGKKGWVKSRFIGRPF
ncbi:MAG: hypothetical protein DYG98_08980 [Haliscomenobacteraceae bacterium CHB4]|nr:hypothetical protein [Saprospiraceae bacterium]MCE7923178.1 hypothetical protein [Haliscomenobacteraceae bacterium CHB4]